MSELHFVPRVLSIAGTDPTGGAGAQADIKAIAAAGGFALSAITAVVSQNTQGVRSIHNPPLDVLESQLDAVFDDVALDGVKIGMLGTAEITRFIRNYLSKRKVPVIVLDPVMVSTSGDRLLDVAAEQEIRELCRTATVITPNVPELAVLGGYSPATDFEQATKQALEVARDLDTTVILKGGHLAGANADNAVVTPDGSIMVVPVARVETSNTHGTGCSLSSALCTRIAGGEDIHQALTWSSAWLSEAIAHADELRIGSGNGPVDHTHRSRRLAAAASTTPWLELADLPRRVNSPSDIPQASATVPSHITSAGPWTKALWGASRQIYREILDLPFIKELGTGKLPEAHFSFYLNQDALYLAEYSKALAALAAKSTTSADQVAWAKSAAGCIEVEAELHRTWLSAHDSDELLPSPITSAYTSFLQARCFSGDLVVGVSAVLPCYWLYAECGVELFEQRHPAHPYGQWLDTYSDDDFLTECQEALERVERAFDEAGPTQRAEALRAYMTACVHEREFFDQASRV